jgi:hypothetical protein
MAERLARSSFPDRADTRRRAVRLAAAGSVIIAVAFAAGIAESAHASTHRPTTFRATRLGDSLGAMRDQPPLAHTGGFGEPTCLACHMDGELNEAGGSLAIDGAPARYEPGGSYRLTITVKHPSLKLAGFELAARFASGADSAKQAGTLSVDDDRAGVTADDSTHVQYAHHLRSGTTPLSPGVGRWTVIWAAPRAGSGPVVIHVASNAANDNDSPMGDYIYARSVTVSSAEK